MLYRLLLMAFLAGGLCGARAAEPAAAVPNRPPVIKHDPVLVALPGQAISIRALVTDDSGSVKSVNLFCATSKDAAPFPFPMTHAGAGSYIGSIPARLVGSVPTLTYYVAATDGLDATTETPWYTVRLSGGAAPTGAGAVGQAGGTTPSAAKPWWKRPAVLWGGGALVAGGAVAAAVSSGGSGGGGSSPPPDDTVVTNAGTYVGTCTKTLEIESALPVTTTYPVTFTVLKAGTISTDTLSAGNHMEATLSGTSFSMLGPVGDTNAVGDVQYVGTLLGGRITGAIQGTVTSASGLSGTCYGTFYAIKQ